MTPPRQVTSALGKGRNKPGISAARSNPRGAKPAGYLMKKFNANAFGVRSIKNRFNKAAGNSGGGNEPTPKLKPPVRDYKRGPRPVRLRASRLSRQ